jgi:RNA polymerase sigma-70 factor (ECF subfamily)
MGVLLMTIPRTGQRIASGGRLLPAAIGARQGSQGEIALQVAGTAMQSVRPSARTKVEAGLQTTLQQDAAQEMLGRLVRRCVEGDGAAWQQLVTGQHRRIYAICYRFTGSAVDAEDLTQEVFLKLYRHLASFDCERGRFQTWITTAGC